MTSPGAPSPAAVTVLAFAAYAEALGAPDVRVPWRDGLTVADVVAAVRRMPGGGSIPVAPLVAVNQRYADAAARLRAEDEVALIPPVAGG